MNLCVLRLVLKILLIHQSKEQKFENSLKWIKADANENKANCEAGVADASIVLADGAGTDVLTIDPGSVTGDITLCDDDRADVAALKAIINKVATDNPAIFGVPADDTMTGSQRAAEMIDTFVAALDTWDGAVDTNGENTQLQQLVPGPDTDNPATTVPEGNEFKEFRVRIFEIYNPKTLF